MTHELLIFTLVVVLVIAVACWIVHLPAPALGTQLAEGDFDGGVRHPIRVPGVGGGELLLVLLLAGCSISGDDSPVAVNATPNCEAQAVRCTVYEWNLGVLQATKSGGTHIHCRCTAT